MSPPCSIIMYAFLTPAGKKVSMGKQVHQAYLSELLHTSKNPHHTVNLLLQAPGPVLHPAIQRRKRCQKGLLELQLQQPIPGHPGGPGQLLTQLNFHQRRNRHRNQSEPVIFFPLKSGPVA